MRRPTLFAFCSSLLAVALWPSAAYTAAGNPTTPSAAFDRLTLNQVEAPSWRLGLTITGTTKAESHTSGAAPDANGAAGPDHVVEFINGDFKAFDKRTGKLIKAMSSQEFWDAALDSKYGPNPDNKDPRLLYDAQAKRWYATAQRPAYAGANFVLARSNGEDPLKGWKGVGVEAFTDRPPGAFVDFDRLGYNTDGLFITINQFLLKDGRPAPEGVAMFFIKKSDFLQDSPVLTINRREQIKEARDIVPVVDHDGRSHVATLWGLSASRQSTNDLFARIDVTGDLASWTLDHSITTIGDKPGQLLARTRYPPGTLLQPGGQTALPLGKQPSAVHLINGDFWEVHTISHPDDVKRSAFRWWRIRASDNAVLGQGVLSDPSLNMILPSMAIDAKGNIVVVGTGLDAKTPLSVFALSGRIVGDSVTFDPAFRLVKAGVADAQSDGRWGDYTTTSADPEKPGTFWTFAAYPQANGEWATVIAQIIVSDSKK